MTTEVNPGEIKVQFENAPAGKISLAELGFKNEDLELAGGMLRFVVDLGKLKDYSYFQVPTLEFAYAENMGETHWQCDFNGKTILDKTDNHGHNTIVLLDRKKMEDLAQHHENALVVHAEFPEVAHLLAEKCFLHLFK